MNMKVWMRIVIIFAIQLLLVEVGASPISLNYQGRIIKTNGEPLEYGSVSFLFQIMDPGGACVLYEEQVDGYNMENSKGIFDRSIGMGNRSFPTTGTFTILDSFNNLETLACKGGSTYTPSADDIRKLRVRFYDGTGWKLIDPDSVIRSVPYAGHASSANKFAGHELSEFLLKAGIPNCDADEYLAWTGTAFSCATLPSSGSSGTVTQVSVSSPLSIVNGTTAPAISLAKADAANNGYLSSGDWSSFNSKLSATTTFAGDVSGTFGTTSVDKIKGSNVTITSLTSGNFLKYVGSSWVNADLALNDISGLSAQLATKIDVGNMPATCGANQTLTFSSPSGSWVCSNILISGSAFASQNQNLVFASPNGSNGTPSFRALTLSDLPPSLSTGAWSDSGGNVYRATGSVGVGTSTPQSLLQVAGGVQIGMDNASCAAGKEGTLRYNVGNVEYCNGGSWEAFGISGAGITAFNGATTASQSFAVPNQSGLAPAWSSNPGTGVHTLSIPMASTSSVTAGLLSNADYVALNAKLSASSTFSGDMSGTLTTTSVDKIKGVPVSMVGNATGKVLTFNGTSWVPDDLPAGSAGTVTNVTASSPLSVLNGTSAPAISLSKADTSTDGYLSSADWNSFNAKLSAATAFTGDVSGTYGVMSVDKIKGVPVSMTGNAAGKVLTFNGTSWAPDSLPAGNVGTVTNVVVNAPLSVINGTSAPEISLPKADASTNGYLSSGDWSSFNSKLGTSTTFAGDVSGTYGATSVDRIKGSNVNLTSLVSGNFLKYVGSSWVNANLAVSDISGLATQLGSKIDVGNMPATCGVNQTLTFSSPSGAWVCSNILITGSAFASQSQNLVLASPAGAAGTPVFRGLAMADLPSSLTNGLWTDSGADVYRAAGNVGIGTSTPSSKLTVSGGSITLENDSSLALGIVFKPNDPSSTYSNTDDERQFQWMATGFTAEGTFGYKWSWRNADGTPRKDVMTFHKDGAVKIPDLGTTQVTETAVNLGSALTGTVTMDLALGTYLYGTVTGNTTFAVSNFAPAGKVSSFTLELINGGSKTITWMPGVKWPGGVAPSLTAAGTDILVCSTRDGAVTWRCVAAEINSK